MKHRYKWLVTPDKQRVQIDAEIAPLIRRLWDMELVTFNSCQDNFGYVWIQFATAYFAEVFLSTIVKHGNPDLQERAANPYDVCPRKVATDLPDYDAPLDSWLIAANVFNDDDDDVWIAISIRFPRDHLASVMDAVSRSSDDI